MWRGIFCPPFLLWHPITNSFYILFQTEMCPTMWPYGKGGFQMYIFWQGVFRGAYSMWRCVFSHMLFGIMPPTATYCSVLILIWSAPRRPAWLWSTTFRLCGILSF